MKLKPAILALLSRDQLKQIVDGLGVADVDRRSVDAMRAAVGACRRASTETLLGYLAKDAIKTVCTAVGVPGTGRREELVQRLLTGDFEVAHFDEK
jgi:hypothetical protein